MNKYSLDNFRRADNFEKHWAVNLDEAVTARRNLLIFQVGAAVVLTSLALWGAWLIGLDLVFWGILLVVGIAVSFMVVFYLWDKAWDFGFWLRDQKKLLRRAEEYGVVDE